MNCLKIYENFKISKFEKLDLKVSYGLYLNRIWKGIKYFRLNIEDELRIRSIIPESIRTSFDISLMEINGSIPPHDDDKILSSINIYIDTVPCITQFYKINNSSATIKIKNQSNGKIFNLNNLIKQDNFIAKNNEVWLLDVTKPHSVHPINENENFFIRTAIVLQSSKYPFDTIKEMLKK